MVGKNDEIKNKSEENIIDRGIDIEELKKLEGDFPALITELIRAQQYVMSHKDMDQNLVTDYVKELRKHIPGNPGWTGGL